MAADTDGDGLLDLVDAPGFQPSLMQGDFSNAGIQDLDGANLLTIATSLDLHTNRITSIEGGDLAGLHDLVSLALGRNQISTIETGSFNGLANLQRLSLWSNEITSIDREFFRGLVNLRQLHLADNPISNIEDGAFRGLAYFEELLINGTPLILTELNLTGATLLSLRSNSPFGRGGHAPCCFSQIPTLILNDALLSHDSFEAIYSCVGDG
jgi:Leucine-rich repeat (LRR) protein